MSNLILSTVEKVGKDTYHIEILVSKEGGSFKIPVPGDHFIDGSKHFVVDEVKSVPGNELAFEVKASETEMH